MTAARAHFLDDEACLKCGYFEQPIVRYEAGDIRSSSGEPVREHLELTCRGCGFTRSEPCIDSISAAGETTP